MKINPFLIPILHTSDSYLFRLDDFYVRFIVYSWRNIAVISGRKYTIFFTIFYNPEMHPDDLNIMKRISSSVQSQKQATAVS